MSFLRQLQRCWKNVTVEPTLAIYLIMFEFIKFSETNLILQKTCRFDNRAEPDLNTVCDNEEAGEIYVAGVNWRFSFILAGAVIFTTLASAWSDNHNFERRHMIFIPVLGQLILSIFGLLNAYFWSWHPMILVIGGLLIEGLTGAKICIVLGSELYVSSITSTSERSFRIGVITAINYIFLPIGAGISGFMIRQFGFTKSFLFCIPLEIIALSVGYLKIKSSSPHAVVIRGNARQTPNRNPIRAVMHLFFNKPWRKAFTLLCLLLIDPLGLMPYLGEQTVMYLYFRYRFGWHEKAYSVYTAYKMLGTLVGTMFCTVYMSKHLKIHDGIIGTLAAFWDTVGNVSYFFADQAWELYVIPLYNIFNGVLFAMMASLATKCVEPNEMGYLTSVRSLMQIVSPLSFPLYGLVYKSTLDTLPNAFFLLSVGFNFPTIILFGIAYYLSKDIVFESPSPDTLQSPATTNSGVTADAWKKAEEEKNQLSIS